jgi:thioredoxin reductase (NADPH)
MPMGFKEIYDVIIVGGGPAGLTAGLYCQRSALRTILFEKGMPGGQIAISKEVENYPGVGSISGFDLAERLVRQVRQLGLTIVQDEVMGISAGPELHATELASGARLQSVALILALGGSAKKLGIPGESEYLGKGVSYCGTCDGPFFKDKHVVVVGGGDTAVEESLYLSKLARKVSLVHRGETFRAVRVLQDRLRSEPRIDVLWNTTISSITGNGQAVEKVTLRHARTGRMTILSAEGVFIFIGYRPNSTLVPPAVQINERGFVVTDERCATNVPGIFAIGDLRKKSANQIVIAAGDGAVAALAAARYIEVHRDTSVTMT